jgi:hypothetical protein
MMMLILPHKNGSEEFTRMILIVIMMKFEVSLRVRMISNFLVVIIDFG